MGCSYLARKEGAEGSSLQPQVQVGERGGAHQPNLRPDTRWRVEDEDAKGKWTCCTQEPKSSALTPSMVWHQNPSSPLGGRLVPPALLPGRSGRAGAHSPGPGRASCPHSSQRSCQPSARSSDFPRQPWAVQRATDRNETPSVQTLAPPPRRRPRRGFPNFKP